MYLLLILLMFIAILNWKYLHKPVKKVSIHMWIALLTILIFFLVLYWFFLPNVHRLFLEEPELVARATQIYKEVILQNPSTIFEVLTQDLIGYYSPIVEIYGLGFFLFGFNNISAIKINILVSILNLFLIFYLTYMIIQDKYLSIISVLVLGSSGIYMTYATSAYTPMIALMFSLLSSIFFWMFIKNSRKLLMVISGGCLGLAALTRVEYIILAPLFVWWLVLISLKHPKKKHLPYWIKSFLALFLLLIPLIWLGFFSQLKMRLYNWDIGWGIGSGFGPLNILDNIKLFFGSLHKASLLFPYIIIFIICLFITLVFLTKRKRILGALFILSIALVFLLNYMMVHYTQIQPYYFIPIFTYSFFIFGVPFSILSLHKKLNMGLIMSILIISIFLFLLSQNIPKVIDFSLSRDNSFMSYHLSVIPRLIQEYLPSECCIVNPHKHTLMMGTSLNVIDIDYFLENQKNNCCYFFEDIFCRDTRMSKSSYCLRFKNIYRLEPILIIKSRKQEINYTLYKILGNEIDLTPNIIPKIVYINP